MIQRMTFMLHFCEVSLTRKQLEISWSGRQKIQCVIHSQNPAFGTVQGYRLKSIYRLPNMTLLAHPGRWQERWKHAWMSKVLYKQFLLKNYEDMTCKKNSPDSRKSNFNVNIPSAISHTATTSSCWKTHVPWQLKHIACLLMVRHLNYTKWNLLWRTLTKHTASLSYYSSTGT